MKVLSIDISSSTIGWSTIIINDDLSFPVLDSYGYIKPSKKGELCERALDGRNKYIKLLNDEKPDVVVVEDYASKFSRGKSSARTIIVLAVFNEMIKMTTVETVNFIPISYPVATIRSVISKEFSDSVSDKSDVLSFCQKKFLNYKTTLNRVDNIKKECYDECDSIIVGICHYVKLKKANEEK
jgi:hypothetical protein